MYAYSLHQSFYPSIQLNDSSSVSKKSDALVQELEGKVETLRKESEASMQQCNHFRSKIKVSLLDDLLANLR